MFMRRGPGLVRAAAVTTVAARTYGAVRHHQDQKYPRQDWEQQLMYAAQQQQ
jgi:signal recognition particle subunit SEC65